MARRKNSGLGFAIVAVLAIVLIIWVIENIVGLLGLALAGWGIYELVQRKKLNTKFSWAFIVIGLIIGIGWFSLTGDETEQAMTSPSSQEQTQADKQQSQPPSDVPQSQLNNSVNDTSQNSQHQSTQYTNSAQTTNEETTSNQENKYITATVIEIVDGDTIKVRIDGKEENVRLLLVDTPETKDPNEPVQPFGPEATEFAEKTLSGKEVYLEFEGPERDKYDRLLAYLWIGDKIFNQMLLEEGLARVAYVYDPPYTHYDAFLAAEKEARDAKKGIWSIDGYVTADGFQEEVAVVKEPEPVKESKTEQQKEVYYPNCAAARAAGAAPIYKGEPGYRLALDRDKDGVACE